MVMMMQGRVRGGEAVVEPTVSTAAATKSVEEDLSLPIVLADRVQRAITEAESFKSECAELGKHVDSLASMLRSLVRRLTSSPSPYDRPVRRIAAEASKALERAHSVVRRCRRRAGVLRRVVAITTGAADLRKAQSLIEASVGDLRWLLAVYGDDPASIGSLPPIASTDPNLSFVWSHIATVQMGDNPSDRADAATTLANLAKDNDRNKKIIIEEGGLPPLLALVKDGASVDAQIAAATALTALATGRERVSMIVAAAAVPIIVSVLSDGSTRLQTYVARLVANMALHDPVAQEEFARENAIRPLVSILAFDLPLEEPKITPKKHTSIHSLVQINRDLGMASAHPNYALQHTDSGGNSSGSSRGGLLRDYHLYNRKERETESPDVKQQLKIACAEALWMLSKGCIANSRKITETKGLLCLSKIIEGGKGELQQNCLMTVMEIAAAAESDAELRRSAFKTNSPAAKSVVDQLLRVVQQGSTPPLQIPAMKAIGSLARTFPARETRVLSPLVVQLGHWNPDVAAEAARALTKFACPDNFLRVEHSKAIIEFEAVTPLMRLLRLGEKTQMLALVLLCFLALHVPDNEALERAKVLAALESVAHTALGQDPSIREMLPRAIYHLELFRGGAHTHRHASANGAVDYRGTTVY